MFQIWCRNIWKWCSGCKNILQFRIHVAFTVEFTYSLSRKITQAVCQVWIWYLGCLSTFACLTQRICQHVHKMISLASFWLCDIWPLCHQCTKNWNMHLYRTSIWKNQKFFAVIKSSILNLVCDPKLAQKYGKMVQLLQEGTRACNSTKSSVHRKMKYAPLWHAHIQNWKCFAINISSVQKLVCVPNLV